MYDFYDDARHHHRSQCKHWTAFKRQDPSLAWALLLLLGTLGTFGKLYKLGNFVHLDFGLNLLKARNNKLDKCLI